MKKPFLFNMSFVVLFVALFSQSIFSQDSNTPDEQVFEWEKPADEYKYEPHYNAVMQVSTNYGSSQNPNDPQPPTQNQPTLVLTKIKNAFIESIFTPDTQVVQEPQKSDSILVLQDFIEESKSTIKKYVSLSAPVISTKAGFQVKNSGVVAVSIGILESEYIAANLRDHRASEEARREANSVPQQRLGRGRLLRSSTLMRPTAYLPPATPLFETKKGMLYPREDLVGKLMVRCDLSMKTILSEFYTGSLEVGASFISPFGGVEAGAKITNAKLYKSNAYYPGVGLFDYQPIDEKGFSLKGYIETCKRRFTKKVTDNLWAQSKGFYSPLFQNLIYHSGMEQAACEVSKKTCGVGAVWPGMVRKCVQKWDEPKGIGICRELIHRKNRGPCYLYKNGEKNQATYMEYNPKTMTPNERIGAHNSFGTQHCDQEKGLYCTKNSSDIGFRWIGKCVDQKTYNNNLVNGSMNW